MDETFSEEDEDGFGTAEHDDDDDVSSEREASSNESDIYPEWGGFGDGDGSDSGSESEASSEPPQLLRPASSRVELLAGRFRALLNASQVLRSNGQAVGTSRLI